MEVLFFPQNQETLRFSKMFPIAAGVRQQLSSFVCDRRAQIVPVERMSSFGFGKASQQHVVRCVEKQDLQRMAFTA